MKILILSNPRTGSKYFQMKLTEYLLKENSDIAYLKLPYVDKNEFSLGEMFNLDYMYSNLGKELIEHGRKFCYTVNEIYDNIYEIQKTTELSYLDKNIFLNHCYKLLSKINKPFVVKAHFLTFTTQQQQQNLLNFINDNIDIVVCLTRSNHTEWMLSRSILKEQSDNMSIVSAKEYICKQFKQRESFNDLKKLEDDILSFYNLIDVDKCRFDISNLPDIINVGSFTFKNDNKLEFRLNNNYEELTKELK